QGPASSLASPVLDRTEQHRSDPSTSGGWTDPQVPQEGDVVASLEHVDASGPVGDDGTTDPGTAGVCSNETPVARIEPLRPPRRAFTLEGVVVLLPGNVD